MTALPTNPALPKVANHSRRDQGFSLVELTIVLIIVALLSSGLMLGISGQRSVAEHADVQHQLENIREALLGYAMANGRLPCPAAPSLPSDAGGNEEKLCVITGCPTPPTAPVTHPPVPADMTCTLEFGALPWKALGISETDPWGNRFTYFVGLEFSKPLSYEETQSGMRARFTMATEGRAEIQDGASHVIGKMPAVIISHGKRAAGAYQPTGTQLQGSNGDEQENANTTQIFIFRTPNENFDDIVSWVVPSILKSRMVAAGRLP